MNQFDHENKRKRIDSKDSYYLTKSRNNEYTIPYTKNSNNTLHNSNYINAPQISQIEDFDVDGVQALSAALAVTGAFLALCSGFAFAGAVVGAIGTLIPVLWPQAPPGEPEDKTWEALLNYGESITKKEILESQKQQAKTKLLGLKNVVAEYEKLYKMWEKNPNNNTASGVRTQFIITHNFFLEGMPFFINSVYKEPLLPSCAEAAALHVLVLNSGAQQFDTWNRQASINSTPVSSSEHYYEHLKKCIKEYTNHCANTYKAGLNSLKQSEGIKWNIYNQYRRDMTLLVLDTIATFHNFDYHDYPPVTTITDNIGTKFQLTREIYTNALIAPYADANFKIEDIEESLTSRPDLFTWLKDLTFYTRNFRGYLPGLTANRIGYQYTYGNTIQSSIYGDYQEGDRSESFSFSVNEYVYSALMTYIIDTGIIQKINFNLTNQNTMRYNTGLEVDPSEQMNMDLSLPRKDSSLPPTYTNYSHVLSSIKTASGDNDPLMSRARNTCFGWTHYSVDRDNKIHKEIITQIPVVKAFNITKDSKVVAGPGYTGGDLILLQRQATLVISSDNIGSNYMIRIRYASNSDTSIEVRSLQNTLIGNVSKTTERTDSSDLQFEDFKYITFTNHFTIHGKMVDVSIIGTQNTSKKLWIDKIEFIPITGQFLSEREREKIEFAQGKVSSFFTDHTKNMLHANVTDYEIDQTATLIESLTEEVYPQEKLMLLHDIKHVKQLSQSRNLLQNGDFASLLGWTTSNDITIQTGNSDFKEYSLHMAGARTTGISNSIFPTYIYQKIQEAALKPYTRYRIRGFVKQSKNMEIFISRYEQEHHMTLKGENHLSPVDSYSKVNIGEAQAISFNDINYCILESPCNENIASFGQDAHIFSYTLDTGEIDLIENLGMELMFQISDPDGFAILGNLEVIEERVLTREEIQQIHEKENRWKKRKQEQQKEAEIAYSQAQQAITNLFANTQFSMLKWETTLQDITMANYLLDKIPNVHHRWLPDKPDSNHNLFIQLKDHISKAYVLYHSRNMIQNGDFSVGFKYWSVSRDATINETDGKSILVIPSWSTQVSQQLHVKPNSQYLLRVRGKKEGKGNGNGYVKISDGGNQVETLTFTSSDNHTNQMYNESEGFITKTLSIRPYTDQLRIDIGETEGTFMIESIELIDMKG